MPQLLIATDAWGRLSEQRPKLVDVFVFSLQEDPIPRLATLAAALSWSVDCEPYVEQIGRDRVERDPLLRIQAAAGLDDIHHPKKSAGAVDGFHRAQDAHG
jgi:hypothetical protein